MEVALIICEVGVNQYGISFKTEDMMEKALDEGLWSIIGFSLTLKRWLKRVSMEDVEFKEIAFWIQAYNIPIDLLIIKNAEVIGNRMGRLIRVDE